MNNLPIEIIIETYNDGLPPNDYQVEYFVQDNFSQDLRRIGCSWGSSIEEIALKTKYSFFGELVSYSICTPLKTYKGKHLGEEGCKLRPLTKEEYHQLIEELEKLFNDEDYEKAFERLTSH